MGTEIEPPFNATSIAATAAAVGGVWGVVAPPPETATKRRFDGSHAAYICLPYGDEGRRSHHREKQAAGAGRVWMCEVCEQAPAAVTCKADAAALCIACDLDIHSANPVAHRHERVPIGPFVDASANENRAYESRVYENRAYSASVGGGREEVDGISWAFPGSGFSQLDQKQEGQQRKDQIFGEMDELLELEYGGDLLGGRFQPSYSYGGSDGVVPVQSKVNSVLPAPAGAAPVVVGHQFLMGSCENGLELDFSRSKLCSFNYPAQSLSNSVSSSSHDAGVVPDGICSNNNSISEISFSFDHNNNPTLNHHTQVAPPAAKQQRGLDRMARVMRYREKRKNRKFEKTIRYASRKAYAETRPRIKGRFAKRCSPSFSENNNSNNEPADHQHHFDEMVLYGSSSSLSFFSNVDGRYGVVPSFR